MIIEAELTNKHKELTELQRRVKLDLAELRSTLRFITYCSLNTAINNRINGKRKAWKETHKKKLKKLFEKVNHRTNSERPPNIVHKTAKVHKVKPEEQDKIEKLPLRPIISNIGTCLLYTSPSPRDATLSRMPSSA